MIWTALWIAWGLAFVGIEGAALRNDNDGTLSVHLRRWFKVNTHLGRTVWLVVSALFFVAWFIPRRLIRRSQAPLAPVAASS